MFTTDQSENGMMMPMRLLRFNFQLLKLLQWFYVRLRVEILFWSKHRFLKFLISILPFIYRHTGSRFWDRLSDENHTKVLTTGRHLAAQLILRQILDQVKFNKLLEVGCGGGENLAYIKQYHPDAILVGCDFSRKQLSFARQYTGIQFDIANARKLPYKDGEFDIVITVGCLVHIPNCHIAQCARELQRVAKKHLFIFEEDEKFTIPILYEISRRSGFHFYHDYDNLFPLFHLDYSANNSKTLQIGLHTHLYTRK